MCMRMLGKLATDLEIKQIVHRAIGGSLLWFLNVFNNLLSGTP